MGTEPDSCLSTRGTGATLLSLANAPGVRGCSALRARADVLLARSLSHAKVLVGAPCVVACANPALRSYSHPARLRVGLGAAHGERWLSTWQPRSRSSAVKSKKLFPGKLMPHSRACPATGSDRGKRDPTLFVMRLSGRALRNGARLTAVDTPFAGRQMQMLLGHTCRQCLEEQRQGRRQVSCHQAASECDLEPSGHQ